MLTKRPVVHLLAAACLAAACGGDSNLGPRGTAAVQDHPGDNTPITPANGELVVGQTIASLGGAFQRCLARAMQQTSAAKVTVHGQSISDVYLDGLASGYLTMEDATYTFDGATHILDGDLSFTDFSDTDELFVGGPLTFEMRLTPATEDNEFHTYYNLVGSLAYAGSYKGAMSMNFTVDLGNNTTVLNGTVTVDGQEVTLGGS